MKFDIPSDKTEVFVCDIPIRWGDMDALGHVNNTVYFRYLESARIEWLQAVGPDVYNDTTGPVVVNAFCNFYKQLTYPGTVRCTLYVSNAGRSSFDTWCLLHLSDDPDTVYAAGGATVVWVDFAQQKSTALPEWVKTLLPES